MESRNVFAQLAAADENRLVLDVLMYLTAEIFVLAWAAGCITIVFFGCRALCKLSEEGANPGHRNPLLADEVHEEAPEEPEEEPEEEPNAINDPLNEALLASVDMRESEIRDHRTIGYFFDPIKRFLTDVPVVLNTGDIVDQDTAKTLVQTQALLPRGRVTGFFDSYPLRNLLGALIDEEVEKRTQAKKK